MRRVDQPGPQNPDRIQWIEARGRAFFFTLEQGLPLLEAVRRGFAAEGFASGTVNIRGGALGPFAYVMPALAKTKANAAFYSDTFRPEGITRLKLATLTLGVRARPRGFHRHQLTGAWHKLGISHVDDVSDDELDQPQYQPGERG